MADIPSPDLRGRDLDPGGSGHAVCRHWLLAALGTLGTSGTSADGTITTAALGSAAAGVPQAFAITSAFVPGGKYVGLQNSGTACVAVTQVSLAYCMGRAY